MFSIQIDDDIDLGLYDVDESFVKNLQFENQYRLQKRDGRIEIANISKPNVGSICVDFVSSKATWRRLHGGGNGQPVAKAVFSKMKTKPSVYDATGGLGRDAFVLASLGCNVTMFERNEIVRILLKDGLDRASRDSDVGNIVRERLRLSSMKTILDLSNEKVCDVVYLDPMYPAKKSSALVKKDMQVFHEIVGQDSDSALLLPKALSIARLRVAVKRPKGAEFLNGTTTYSCIETKGNRFDIYVPNS